MDDDVFDKKEWQKTRLKPVTPYRVQSQLHYNTKTTTQQSLLLAYR